MSGSYSDHNVDFPLYMAQAYTTSALRVVRSMPGVDAFFKPWRDTRANRSASIDHGFVSFIMCEAWRLMKLFSPYVAHYVQHHNNTAEDPAADKDKFFERTEAGMVSRN
jgi:hypothetical protein